MRPAGILGIIQLSNSRAFAMKKKHCVSMSIPCFFFYVVYIGVTKFAFLHVIVYNI